MTQSCFTSLSPQLPQEQTSYSLLFTLPPHNLFSSHSFVIKNQDPVNSNIIPGWGVSIYFPMIQITIPLTFQAKASLIGFYCPMCTVFFHQKVSSQRVCWVCVWNLYPQCLLSAKINVFLNSFYQMTRYASVKDHGKEDVILIQTILNPFLPWI